ncbi:hypothetical protein AAKU61_003803 [Undibacterium sp. GrIS 1.2]|uniref:chromate resistance protein ChrB domain-containing protein n=1 Tax=Undibacterium sp. GrIS 1.2 TaxID=3143933 RepID=UPI00339A49E0
MQWITRERPKIDRIACPWLIVRFIDKAAEFLYVRASEVRSIATDTGAIPYDIPDVELSHVGELCSFDAFLKKYQLNGSVAIANPRRSLGRRIPPIIKQSGFFLPKHKIGRQKTDHLHLPS